MHRSITIFFLVICLGSSGLRAQYSTDGFDSIAIEKPVEISLLFELKHPAIQTARLRPGTIYRHSEPEKKKKAFRRFELPCLLYFNDSSDSEILLYGKWQNIKSWEFGKSGRVDDNSDFRITNDTYLTWDKGMTADLVTGYDTSGRFSVSIHLLSDTSYQQWLTPVYIEQGIHPPNPNPRDHDNKHRSFGAKGWYNGRQTCMVYWGEGKKGWIFYDTTLVAMWKADNDHLNTTQRAKISKRWPPYLLIRQGFTMSEQKDLFRIAFTGRFIAEALKPGQFF